MILVLSRLLLIYVCCRTDMPEVQLYIEGPEQT